MSELYGTDKIQADLKLKIIREMIFLDESTLDDVICEAALIKANLQDFTLYKNVDVSCRFIIKSKGPGVKKFTRMIHC
jgi:hypothetical protein